MFPQVEVKYDPDSSPTTPIVVHVRPHLDLLFSGKGQRLHTICVRRLRDPSPPVTLSYQGIVISSTEEVLRRVVVNRTFGPTYPGDDLRYPGLWFSFEDDTIADKAPQVLDRNQEVKRIFISQKDNDGKAEDSLDEVKEAPIMQGDIARAIIKVLMSAWCICDTELIIPRYTMASFSISLGRQTHCMCDWVKLRPKISCWIWALHRTFTTTRTSE